MCREFVEFLDLNKYDVIYLLQDMAHHFLVQGESLLDISKSYAFSTMELFAITERLKMPCPTTDNAKNLYDFSHVLDFCSQLESLSVHIKKVPTYLPTLLFSNLVKFVFHFRGIVLQIYYLK